MTLCWWSNLGSYTGPRYGLLVTEVWISTITGEMAGSDRRIGRAKDGSIATFDANDFRPGDAAMIVDILPLFDPADDIQLCIWRINLSRGIVRMDWDPYGLIGADNGT